MSVNTEESVVTSDKSDKINFPLLFKWCLLNTNHYYIVFGIGLSIHLFFLLLTIIFTLTNSAKVFYFAFNDIPLYDVTYEPYQCYKAWKYINNRWFQMGFDNFLFLNYSRWIDSYNFRLYYDAGDNNIITSKNLQLIQEIYDKFTVSMNNMKACIKHCSKHPIIISLILRNNGNDTSFANLDQTIDKILAMNYNKHIFRQQVSKDFVKKGGKYFARSIKCEIPVSFIGFMDIDTLISAHSALYNEYYSLLYFYFEYKFLLGELLLSQIYKDVYLTLGSLAFVYALTYIQTKSFLITFFAIFSIFTTFCIGNFIHTIILGIKFFGIFHVLSIFLILGLGCDNLYVFYDRWKSFEGVHLMSLTHRLYSTYVGVGWSMFITSITTALAFFTLAWTKLLTIFSFGVFVALLVLVNYISLLFFIPSVVVIHHCKFHDELKPDKLFIIITRFFKVHYYTFLKSRFIKFQILTVFGSIAIACIISISQIRVAEEFPSLFVSRFPYSQMEFLRNNYFAKEHVDENLQILLLMGLQKYDFSECAYWNYTCSAQFVHDNMFQINVFGVQEKYMDICNMIINADEDLKKELSLYNDTKSHINCLLHNMNKYYMVKFPNKNFQIPWVTSNFLELASTIPFVFGNHTPGPDFPYKFETALYNFLTDGYTFSNQARKDFRKNYELSRYTAVKYGLINGYDMKFSAILINITLFQKLSSFTEKKRIFSNWIKWIENLKKIFNIMVCGSQEDLSLNGYFHWIHVQQMLISAAVAGVISGLLVACPIVLCATLNIITFCIIMFGTCLSTLTVASFIYIVGWNLGLLESINLTVVVGLTIDYLVHMGLAFNSSEKEDRDDRVEDMLEEMGVSILSGMATTLGSSFFLLFCQTKFLFQFGIFVFLTIFSAGVYSMIFLPCMFLICGPRRGQGDFGFHFYRRMICCKTKVKENKISLDEIT